VRLPPDEEQDTSGSARAEDGFPPAPGARAPTPTPAAKRCVRAATGAASAALRARIAGGGPVEVSGRTRAATLRGAAVAVSRSSRPATEAGGAAAPAGVRDAAGASDAPHTSVDSCIGGGAPASPQSDDWRVAGAPRAMLETMGHAAAAEAPVAPRSGAHDAGLSSAPAAPPPSVSDVSTK